MLMKLTSERLITAQLSSHWTCWRKFVCKKVRILFWYKMFNEDFKLLITLWRSFWHEFTLILTFLPPPYFSSAACKLYSWLCPNFFWRIFQIKLTSTIKVVRRLENWGRNPQNFSQPWKSHQRWLLSRLLWKVLRFSFDGIWSCHARRCRRISKQQFGSFVLVCFDILL